MAVSPSVRGREEYTDLEYYALAYLLLNILDLS